MRVSSPHPCFNSLLKPEQHQRGWARVGFLPSEFVDQVGCGVGPRSHIPGKFSGDAVAAGLGNVPCEPLQEAALLFYLCNLLGIPDSVVKTVLQTPGPDFL